MISTRYVHEKDDENKIRVQYESAMEYFNKMDAELLIYEKKIEDDIMFMEYTEESEEIISEGVSDILGKIGQKVINLVDACIKFIHEKIDMLNHYLWEKKDKDKLLKKMEEDKPEVVEKIRIAIDEDKLKLNDFKDLATFYKEIDSVLDNIDAMDMNSARGRMAKAKEKLDKSADTVIKVGKVVGSIGTIAATFMTFKGYVTSGRRSEVDEMGHMDDIAKSQGKKLKSMQKEINGVKLTYEDAGNKESDNSIANIRRKQSILSMLASEFNSCTQKVINKRVNYNKTMMRGVDRVLASYKGGEGK